jgi:hypothetical protein
MIPGGRFGGCWLSTAVYQSTKAAEQRREGILSPLSPPVLPASANVSDVDNSRAEFVLHTNAKRRVVIESQRLECSRAAAGFAAKTFRS